MLKLFIKLKDPFALSVNFIDLSLLTITIEILEWAISGGYITIYGINNIILEHQKNTYYEIGPYILLNPREKKMNCHPNEP